MTQYYVYGHKDPRTGKYVYIGMGAGQRAWMMRNSGKTDSPAYGHRSKIHYEWYEEMEKLNYHLGHLVVIIEFGHTKQSAKELEVDLIRGYKPMFNKHHNPDVSFKDLDNVRKCKTLRATGMSFSMIAKECGISTMTAHRNCQ